jgi:hypothetical protein
VSGSDTYLSEGSRVELVLGSDLKTDVVAGLGVPDGTSTGLNSGVDALVVRSGENAEGVGGSDGGVVERRGVSNSGGVLGDGSLLHIVADLTTNNHALVAHDGVGDGANSASSRVVDEGAAMEAGLLEVKVDLLALVAGSGAEVGEDLGLQAAGEGVVQLDLGGQHVGGVPRLSDADACAVRRQHVELPASCIGAPPATRRLRRVKYIRLNVG